VAAVRLNRDEERALIRIHLAGSRLRECVAKLEHDPRALDEWDAAVKNAPEHEHVNAADIVARIAGDLLAAEVGRVGRGQTNADVAQFVDDARRIVALSRALAR